MLQGSVKVHSRRYGINILKGSLSDQEKKTELALANLLYANMHQALKLYLRF